MKKFVSLVLIFCIIASTICTVYAADWATVTPGAGDTWGEYRWKISGTTLYLDYYGSNGSDGKTVVADYNSTVGDALNFTNRPWQSSVTTITAIVITGNPDKIAAHQFRNMSKLRSVTFAGTETVIDGNAFTNCSSLGPVFVVPAHITKMGRGPFNHAGIVSLIFEETSTPIQLYPLTYLGRLKNITLMRPVKNDRIDGGTTNIMQFGGTYGNIGAYGMTNPAKINFLVTDENYFKAFKKLEEYPDPYNTTQNADRELGLEVGTFDKCTVIDAGQTIAYATDTEDKAVDDTLMGVSHLLYTENGKLTVEFLAHQSVTMGNRFNTDADEDLNAAAIHNGLTANLSANATDIKKMVFSAGFDKIGDYFSLDNYTDKVQQYTNVEELVLPATLDRIAPYAFYNMPKLAKVNFEDTRLTAIDTATFRYVPIRSIALPTTIKHIFNEAFTDNTELRSLYLPVTANTTIRQYAFGAKKSSEAYVGKRLEVILDGVCTLTPKKFELYKACELAFANEVEGAYRDTTLVYDSAEWTSAPSFDDVTAVVGGGEDDTTTGWTIELPGESDTWGEYRWKVDGTTLYLDYYGGNASDGKTVVANYNTTNGDALHFNNRPWKASAGTITDVVLQGTPDKIGEQQFRGMSKLESVEFAGTEQSIGKEAFCNCTNLGPIFTVPAHITIVGLGAFNNTLTVSLIFEETTSQIQIYNLAYMPQLKNITMMRPNRLERAAIKDFCGVYNSGSYGMTNPAKINFLVTDESYFTPFANLTEYTDSYTPATDKMEMGLNVGKFDKCTVIEAGQTITFYTNADGTLSHLLYTENGELTAEFLTHSGDKTIASTDISLTAQADNIKKMVFSAGIREIGANFTYDGTTQQYPNVEELVLPATLNKIGASAFCNMSNLANVNFEDTALTVIDEDAFRYVPIENITLPATVTHILNKAFADNVALETLYLPVTATTTVRPYAFGATAASDAYDGKSLDVTLDGVCTITEEIDIDGAVSALAFANQADGTYRDVTVLYDDEEWATVPDFEDATVTDGWTYENPEASDTWTAYKWKVDGTTLYLDYYGTNAEGKTVVANYNTTGGDAMHFNNRPWKAYAGTITDVVLQGTPDKIGEQQFRGMSKLESVEFAGTEQSIGKEAFCNCTNLGPIFTVPAHITIVGLGAFNNTLTVSLIFEETTSQIQIYNLAYMPQLKNITLMRPIKNNQLGRTTIKDFCGMYNNGTYGMTNPAKINFLVTDESYFTPFANLTEYTDSYTPATDKMEMGLNVGKFDKYTVIDAGQAVAFGTDVADTLSHLLYTENGELTVEFLAHTSMNMSLTNNDIGTAVFANLAAKADDIKKMVFSIGVNMIGTKFTYDGTTQQYPNVEELVLPATLHRIGSYAFYNMSKLEKVNFEDTVITAFDTAAFRYAPIKSITLPTTVTHIFNEVFTDNTELETLYLPVTETTTVRQYVFGASTGSDAYDGKSLTVTLEGLCTLTTETGKSGVVSDKAFANQADGTYRAVTVVYDNTKWADAPVFAGATAVPAN